MTDKLPKNVVARPNKDGSLRYYRRVIETVGGKRHTSYRSLPDRADPRFATELARINALVAPEAAAEIKRADAAANSIAALIREFRPTLANREGKKGTRITKSSMNNWNTYLKQIGDEHGNKIVADIRRSHLYKMQEDMAHMPGKANSYMSTIKGLLEFAAKHDWIAANPAQGLGRLKTGENAPWPPHVIKEAMDAASPVVRLAIVTGLCSGQRISDVIRMRDDWHDSRFMRVPASKKTATPAVIPMHARWLEEIAAVKAMAASQKIQAMTLVFGQLGKPFQTTAQLQKEIRDLMIALGHVETDQAGNVLDRDGEIVTEAKGNHPATLYSFHGLSKNAICYLTELGLDETTIEAIVGKTPQTIRLYAKETKKWMLAERAAGTVIAGRFDKLVAGDSSR